MSPSSFTLPRWLLPATLIVIVLGFAVRNLPWHLDDYDQAKQAYVSFEMVKEGHWAFQHTPTGRIATKPPLAGWISAGLSLATLQTGWDFAWRFPPLAAAVLMLGILVRAGHRLGGALTACVAAGAYGLNLMAPRLATLVRTDMLLCLTAFLVGYLIYEKLRQQTPWTTGERWQIFFLLLASMLIKGPIIYAFLLPGLAAFWWLGRDAMWGPRAWSGWWSWTAPLAFFALWAVAGIFLSQEFYEQVVRDEFFGRFTVGEAAKHNNQPIYFYFTSLLHRCFPWSLLLIAGFCVPDVRAKLRRDPSLCWLACWAIGGLVFMSLVPSKRNDRVFSVVPTFALLLSAMVALLPQQTFSRWVTLRSVRLFLLLAALFSGSYTAYNVWSGYRHREQALVQFGRTVRHQYPDRRLAVINGKEEGLLLYLQVPHFTRPDEAMSRWQARQIDGMVLPAAMLAKVRDKLGPYRVEVESYPLRRSGDEDGKVIQYLLITPQS